MTLSTNANAWIAAGVQQAVLARTMPAIRHDLAGSVSVLRMGIAVLKRKLETSTEALDKPLIEQRLVTLDSGVGDLSASLKRLRHWDHPTGEKLTLCSLLNEICELARPFLAMRSIELRVMPDEPALWPETTSSPQPMMYVVLACIYHLAEGRSNAPALISALPVDGGIRITGEGESVQASEPISPDSRRQLATPVIDLQSLHLLCAHLKAELIEHEANCFELRLR